MLPNWLYGWTYRKSVTISRASGRVSSYQMKIKVGRDSNSTGYDVHCEGNVLSTFNDLRFTDYTGKITLPYWIESIDANFLATVWVSFNYIETGNTTFYMYYGNASASAVSSGANTFLFFDHFDSGSSPSAQWATQGTPSVASSEVTLKSAASTWDAIKAASYTIKYCRFRCKAKLTAVQNHMIGLSSAAMSTTFYAVDSEYFLSSPDHSGCVYWTSSHAGAVSTPAYAAEDTNYHLWELLWAPTNCPVSKDDAAATAETVDIASVVIAPRADGAHGASLGNLVVDWLFVSQYLDPEPAFGSWTSQITNTLIPRALPIFLPGI